MDFKTPLFLLFVLVSTSQALKFDIGGSSGWSLNPSENYNQWSGRNRFQVNDILVFKYKKGSDSVLEVTKEAYDKCNKTNPINKFEDGNTEFTLDRSGPFYFISGNDQNCEKGQKLALVVISPRGHTPSSPSPSPSTATPSPSATSPSPSVSTSPTANSPSVSTPPAGEPTAPPPTAGGPPAPSPLSPSVGASPPSQSPTIPADGTAPSGSASLAPGAAAVPPASSDSIAPSTSLVYSVAVVVGAVFVCYGSILG
ncbi:early nodulin-like protein 14 [Vicia villosa]|uniref:early nodulin-like protein 14 n=1 Tax=Vicia villosa TaxID=3911 RepID=UPI00273C9091|nr:early nodulin-like protein 14 [Vicia villosa]